MMMTKMIIMMPIDIEVVKIGTGEALAVLDKLANLKCLLKEERNSFVAKSAEQLAKPYH